jgi:class 3 adenylate cyclase
VSESLVCFTCGQENAPGQAFCGSCGASLGLICAACGTENPAGYKFCGQCGIALISARVKSAFEERRVISVVFADLVGFTSRAEQMDPEDLRSILDPYYRRLRAELEAHGGTVEKFIGDAVMAVFGAPVAHGDDPERAVRAALAIRDAIPEMNAEAPDVDLQMRLAVNTGEAIVTFTPGAESSGGMVAGDVVNTAARLQTAAPVNGILVGEETHRATSSVIAYEPVEALAVKGKQEPVRAWLALSSSLMPGVRARRETPFVGRTSEFNALQGAWARVLEERSAHLVTVLGVPGIGKSRLTDEFLASVADSARIIPGRSLPYGAGAGYGAFAQQVMQIAGIFDTDPIPVATRKLEEAASGLVDEGAEELASHLAILVGLTHDEVADRRTLFFSVRRLVEELAARQPLVLIFEDIHWADGGLLDLIETLGSLVQNAPVLLLTLARPDLMDSRPGWGSGLRSYTSIHLDPLGPEAAEELALRLLGQDDIGERAARLALTSEGNPLFIEELAASVSEHATDADGKLPTSVRNIISARLDALPEQERSVVLAASAIGKVFWVGALERLHGQSDGLHEALDSLEHRGLLRREAVSRIAGDAQYSFKHMLIREVAYETLPKARRRDLHMGAADFIEDVAGERSAEWAPLLAIHYRNAEQNDRAVEYLLLAADQAGRGWAKDLAVDFFDRAIQLMEPEDDRLRSIRLQRAIAEQMAYHIADAENLRRARQAEG